MLSGVRLPRGVRDYLPAAAAARRAVADGLAAEIEAWGYRRIVTPAYEYEAVLALGLGERARAQAVKFVEPLSGEVVALRPDITPQVARLVATRFADERGPIRLAYEGQVVRLGDGAAPQRELFQAGVELIDAPAPEGDVEVIALAAAALARVGVRGLVIDLGAAALVDEALVGIDDPQLLRAIRKRDPDAADAAARRLALPASRRKLIAALPSLHGGPEVIDRAARLVGKAPRSRAALRELARIADGATAAGANVAIDLGELVGAGYYTGVRFQGFAPGAGDALLSGGRYDHLIERYGRAARAAGFAVDVERVATAVRAARGGSAPVVLRILVGGEAPLAHRLACALRGRGVIVLLHLGAVPAALADAASNAGCARAITIGRRGLRWADASGAASGQLRAARSAALLDGSAASNAALDALLPPR